MLYECKYSKTIWKIFKNVFGYKISEIISDIWNNQNLEHIITLTCFLIYKEWLLLSLDGKIRNGILNASFYSNELSLRQKIYLNCKMNDQARNVNILMHAFETISAIQS